MPINQHRSVINDDYLKEGICRKHSNIESTEQEDAAINARETSASDPLRKAEQAKARHAAKRYNAQIISERVEHHVYASQAVEPSVDRCQPYA